MNRCLKIYHPFLITVLFLVHYGKAGAFVWNVYSGDHIQTSLDKSSHGDTIFIHPGTYKTDNLLIDKSITLIGINYPVIASRQGNEILSIVANNVNIIGLEFYGVKTNYLKENAAIHVKSASNCTLIKNKIKRCFFGIYLERAHGCQVAENVIIGESITETASGNAIHAWYCNDLNIRANKVTRHRDGIYFEFVNRSSITNNKSYENTRYGLHFMFSNQDTYSNNTFLNNGVGVAVMFSNDIIMYNNLFKDNWGKSAYGLLLKEIRDAEIFNNDFIYNTIGIYVEGASRINYEQNNFVQNGCSVKISGGCEDNNIQCNNFINNHLDLEIYGSIDQNSIAYNYWASYSGYDLNKDDIGDVPYYPVKLFSHVLAQSPEAIVLMRSLLVQIINYAESVSPVFTPVEVYDPYPHLLPF